DPAGVGGGVAAAGGTAESDVAGEEVAAGAAAEAGAAGGAVAAGAAAAEAKPPPLPGPWARYPAGRSFLAALAGGRAPRAAWSTLPGPHWPEEIAVAAATASAAGKGALIVVPDARDLGLVDAALADVLGAGRHVCLAAGLGPAE